MGFGRIAALGASIALGLLGLLYLLSLGSAQNTNPVGKGIVGLVLIALAVTIFWITLKKAPDKVQRLEIKQQVDLSGDTELERLTCTGCGAVVESDAIRMADDGSVLVHCPFCNSVYQITEKPTW